MSEQRLMLLLCRHAQSVENAGDTLETNTDSSLSERGILQAERLCHHLATQPLDAIYCSDTRRAIATVEPLAKIRGIDVQQTAQLREPLSGKPNTTFIDPSAIDAAFLERLPTRAPTETLAQLTHRLRVFLHELRADQRARTILICSHFVTLNVLTRLLTVAGDPPPGLWAHFDNASLTHIDLNLSSHSLVGTLKYLNRIAHLADD